jgi:ABC-type Fe3+/spermidine/putrescine transport system ATPase subunit/nucleotide-binding universal stress UspA family protein
MSIALSELSKRYGEQLVVNRVSLEVRAGELFVLLGSSGSGKSTVLRLIAGLIEPDGGRIELAGRDVTRLAPQARGTGFVFQNYSIFRHMTVADNIAFGLRIRRVPAAERRQRCEELLDLIGLAGLGARYPDQLSGGQQQRVALARALAYRPAVLLLDEPFGALDVKIRGQLRQSLKAIQRQLGVTTILVTHDQDEAFELADRLGVIEAGRLLEVGSPAELYYRPHSVFVATFVGGGNVLVGRAEAGALRLGQARLPMPPAAPDHDEGAPARIHFRPESVLVQAEPFAPDSGVHVLGRGQLTERIFAGALERLRLEVADLAGARPLAPAPAYGRRAPLIDALRPGAPGGAGAAQAGELLWVGLRDYHVLDPRGLKLLIAAGHSGHAGAVAALGCRVAQATAGPATLLAVVHEPAAAPAARERLEAWRAEWLARVPRLTAVVRQGADSAAEILRALQEDDHELLVIGHTPGAGLGPVARQVLEHALVPVLLVQSPPDQLRHLLICTAAGEPGKVDVRFGGRLARRLGARATVLHVLAGEAGPAGRARAEQHVGAARATLEGLGVACATRVAQGPPLATILGAARAGDVDLLVIGAPAPRDRRLLRWTDTASPIVQASGKCVLVVPMAE